MHNNFFNTRETAIDPFWQWFNPDEKQRQKIENLIQSILQNNILTKLTQLYGREKTIVALKALNQTNQESFDFINASFAALELGYFDLILEISHNLDLKELADLQQYLEKQQ